jgi:integrase
MLLFKELAERWLLRLQKRVELQKLKPASLAAFTSRVRTHAIPALGEIDVLEIKNGKVREFAEALAVKLGPKSVRENIAVLKMVLQSYVDENGEYLIDLSKWRANFIFENVKDVKDQKRPTISGEALDAIIANLDLRVCDRVFVALAASTGLRRGELLAVRYAAGNRSSSWDKEASAIFVRRSIWSGKSQSPKSDAAVRRIDLATSVNEMLTAYVEVEKKNPGDYLFCTRTGKPLTPSCVNERIVKPNKIPGMHSTRRYRARWLDQRGCPRNLLAEWLGHNLTSNVTDLYIGTADEAYRREWAEKIGTGLDLAAATLPVSKPKAAKPRKTRKNVVAAPAVEPQPLVYTNVYTPEPEPQIDATLSEISRQPASVEQLDELLKMRAQLEALR